MLLQYAISLSQENGKAITIVNVNGGASPSLYPPPFSQYVTKLHCLVMTQTRWHMHEQHATRHYTKEEWPGIHISITSPTF